MSRPDQCWTMTQFADPESVPTSVYDPSSQPPSPKPPPPIPKPPPPSPSPPPSTVQSPPPPSPKPPPPSPSPPPSLDTGNWIQAPEGPSQQCQDDAGPPWVDDGENYPNGRYHDEWPVTPVLPSDGECPTPLKTACEQKPIKAAYMEGPIDCGPGGGWFCRIMEQASLASVLPRARLSPFNALDPARCPARSQTGTTPNSKIITLPIATHPMLTNPIKMVRAPLPIAALLRSAGHRRGPPSASHQHGSQSSHRCPRCAFHPFCGRGGRPFSTRSPC